MGSPVIEREHVFDSQNHSINRIIAKCFVIKAPEIAKTLPEDTNDVVTAISQSFITAI